MSSYLFRIHILNESIFTSCTLAFVLYEFILKMNAYIQTNSNFATEEAADIELAAAADDSVATDAACSASGVSILDDAEGNIKNSIRR